LVRIPSRVAAHHEADILRLILAEGVVKIDQVRVETDGKFRQSVERWPELSGLDWHSGLTEMRPGDVILFLVGERSSILTAVQASRNWVAEQVDQSQWGNELSFLWIVDQPLFKRDPVTGRWKIKHQAFTAPKDPLTLNEKDDPNLGQIRGREYLLVCNGGALGGGSVRIHNADLQRRVFRIDGLSETEIEFYFGHLLRALASAPPHAGATFSLDSLIKLLAREQNASEVIPFPKLGNGLDPLTGAPSAVGDEILEMFKLRLS
jgi:aspartyl-tRNA synthetase